MSLVTRNPSARAAAPASFAYAPGSLALPSHAPPKVSARRGGLAIDLCLRHAGQRRVVLRFESIGDAGLPTVLVAGGISADRHVAASEPFDTPGWWDAHVGLGAALDPRAYRILSFDWVGADGMLDAVLDPADQADAIAVLLDALGIGCLGGFVGSSYGAMVGLQFAARHGARVQHLVAISGAHRAHPFASAWRALQRQAVALGALQCDERHGLALARQLAILSYRTPEEFNARFEAARVVHGRVRVGAEDYLDHCGAKFVANSSPTAFLRLSESLDLQAIAPEAIDVPVTVVAVAEDRLVPLADAYELVERLGRGTSRQAPRLRVLHSQFGHDAFLKETDAIAGVLREAFAQRVEVPA